MIYQNASLLNDLESRLKITTSTRNIFGTSTVSRYNMKGPITYSMKLIMTKEGHA